MSGALRSDWIVEERQGLALKSFGKGSPIVAIEWCSEGVKLGQRVYSNGRFMVRAGTLGLVIEIGVPGEDGRTDDVIRVQFEGRYHPLWMKFKDLEIPPQSQQSA